ncbi:MAG: SapC family protein [Pseudomonadota bacterium]
MGIFGRKKSDGGGEGHGPGEGEVEGSEAAPPDEPLAGGAPVLAEGAAAQPDLAELSNGLEQTRPEAEAARGARLEALSPTAHGHLGVQGGGMTYSFARDAQILPVTLPEFARAAVDHPIVFVGPQAAPSVLMGLRPGENLFIDDAGAFARACYAPAVLRQHPFMLARAAEEGGPEDRVGVAIDRASPVLVENGGAPLFENGAPSEATQRALRFLKTLHQETIATRRFVEELTRLDLIEVKELTAAVRGADGARETRPLIKYRAVSEQKLRALPADERTRLFDSGHMLAIHAHLISLHNWQSLLDRAQRRGVSKAAP